MAGRYFFFLKLFFGDIREFSGEGITSVGRGNCLKHLKKSLGQDKTKEIDIGSVDQLMDDMADLQDEPSPEFCL